MLNCCRIWNVSTKKLLGFGVEGYLVITERNFVGLSTDLFEFGFRSYRNPFIYRTYTQTGSIDHATALCFNFLGSGCLLRQAGHMICIRGGPQDNAVAFTSGCVNSLLHILIVFRAQFSTNAVFFFVRQFLGCIFQNSPLLEESIL